MIRKRLNRFEFSGESVIISTSIYFVEETQGNKKTRKYTFYLLTVLSEIWGLQLISVHIRKG